MGDTRMIKREIKHFNIEQICRSGQCFRMEAMEKGRYRIIAGSRYLEIFQSGEICEFYCDDRAFENFWFDYFDLGRDYGACIEKINPRDTYLMQAAEFGSGIRILHQDMWEMIVTFLISQQNNIVRIRRCVQNICEAYGKVCVTEDGTVYYAFPEPEVLAQLDEDDLKACNLGYRSKYVVRTARAIADGEADLDRISRLSYKKAKEELLKLFGVGDKVADCICLFALHHLEAFPRDTHMNQVMEKHYKRGFPNRRYKGMQGIMQQYIFHYELFGKQKE